MIIPVILNLKGNLEMNLSARLGTAANMGDLDHPSKRHSIILGNLSLLQVQATIVSFVAVCVSFLMNRIMEASGDSNPQLLGDVTTDFTRGLYARGVHKPKPHKPPLPLPPSGPAEYVLYWYGTRSSGLMPTSGSPWLLRRQCARHALRVYSSGPLCACSSWSVDVSVWIPV